MSEVCFDKILFDEVEAPLSYTLHRGKNIVPSFDQNLYRLFTFQFHHAKSGNLCFQNQKISLLNWDPLAFSFLSFTFKEGGKLSFLIYENRKNIEVLLRKSEEVSSLPFKEKMTYLIKLWKERTLYYLWDSQDDPQRLLLQVFLSIYEEDDSVPLVLIERSSPFLHLKSPRQPILSPSNELQGFKNFIREDSGEFVFQFVFMVIVAFVFSYGIYNLLMLGNILIIVSCFLISFLLLFLFCTSTYSVIKKAFLQRRGDLFLDFLALFSGVIGAIPGVLLLIFSLLCSSISSLGEWVSHQDPALLFTGFILCFLSFLIPLLCCFFFKNKRKKV